MGNCSRWRSRRRRRIPRPASPGLTTTRRSGSTPIWSRSWRTSTTRGWAVLGRSPVRLGRDKVVAFARVSCPPENPAGSGILWLRLEHDLGWVTLPGTPQRPPRWRAVRHPDHHGPDSRSEPCAYPEHGGGPPPSGRDHRPQARDTHRAATLPSHGRLPAPARPTPTPAAGRDPGPRGLAGGAAGRPAPACPWPARHRAWRLALWRLGHEEARVLACPQAWRLARP